MKQQIKFLIILLALGLIFLSSFIFALPKNPPKNIAPKIAKQQAAPQLFGERPEVQKFIQEVAKQYNFDPQKLTKLFNTVKPLPKVIHKERYPFEENPWFTYRKHFVTPERVQAGVEFWKKHAKTLARAQRIYGIPASIIVAIIGTESQYGLHTGNFKVLDALANLTFDFPERADFFRMELTEFLLMCREKHINPTSVLGSYAGAIGQPQFMPSSFRKYAVDFSHNGRIDLSHDEVDVIGSIANYLNQHGWETHHPIYIKARLRRHHAKKLPPSSHQINFTLAKLKKFGIIPVQDLPDDTPLGFIKLQDEDGYEYWLGLNNMYVIKTYNRSILYTMAVYQLSNKLQEAYQAALQPQKAKEQPKNNKPAKINK